MPLPQVRSANSAQAQFLLLSYSALSWEAPRKSWRAGGGHSKKIAPEFVPPPLLKCFRRHWSQTTVYVTAEAYRYRLTVRRQTPSSFN